LSDLLGFFLHIKHNVPNNAEVFGVLLWSVAMPVLSISNKFYHNLDANMIIYVFIRLVIPLNAGSSVAHAKR
jgi:hypothetical protein